MALKACKECKTKISTQALFCPKCGYQEKANLTSDQMSEFHRHKISQEVATDLWNKIKTLTLPVTIGLSLGLAGLINIGIF